MRVVYFHQYFATPSVAGGNRSYWMAKALSEAGHQVHIVCAGDTENSGTGIKSPFVRGKRTGLVEGFRVTEFDIEYKNHFSFFRRSLAFFKYAIASVRLVLVEDCDIVFCSSTPLTAGIPGIISRWIRKKIFIFEVRDLWPELPKEMGVITNPLVLWGMSCLEWISYRSAHACIGLSPGIANGIKKRNPSNQSVAMIPNGCDLGMFDNEEASHFDIPGIEENDFVVIFPGAHGIANGLDSALDAAAILQNNKNSSVKFLFVGDGKLKPALLTRKDKEGLSNCIFLPPTPKTELGMYLKRANIGLMSLKNVPAFYYGTSPNKFFDYLAAGLPVLNNYPGWLADLINEHNLGRVVAPESPEDMANTLLELSDNKDELKEMGSNCLLLAHDQFDRKLLAKKFVNFLHQQFAQRR